MASFEITTDGYAVVLHNCATRPPGSIWITVVFSWHLPWSQRPRL